MEGERFALVAGEPHLAMARRLGWSSTAVVITEATGARAVATAPKTCCAKLLTALEEARVVEKTLADGYTVDGAATVLGWHKRRVNARRRVLAAQDSADAGGEVGRPARAAPGASRLPDQPPGG